MRNKRNTALNFEWLSLKINRKQNYIFKIHLQLIILCNLSKSYFFVFRKLTKLYRRENFGNKILSDFSKIIQKLKQIFKTQMDSWWFENSERFILIKPISITKNNEVTPYWKYWNQNFVSFFENNSKTKIVFQSLLTNSWRFYHFERFTLIKLISISENNKITPHSKD